MMKKQLLWVALVVCLIYDTWAQTAPQETCQIDFAIMIDESGSIVNEATGGIDNWYSVINFTQNAIRKVKNNPGSNIAVMTFGNGPRLKSNFDRTDTDEIIAIVEKLRTEVPNANTNTSSVLEMADRLVFAIQALEREIYQDVILLMTDGVPTYGIGWPTPLRLADNEAVNGPLLNAEVLALTNVLKDKYNALVLTVGVTSAVNEALLRNMSTDPTRDYFKVTDFDVLAEQLDNIIASTCTVLTTPTPLTECREPSDIYFMLDASGSIHEDRFKTVRGFVADMLVPKLSPGIKNLIGATYYSSEDYELFDLNDFTTVETISDAIRVAPFMRQKTNAAASLNYMAETGFTEAKGNRAGARDIVVIFTDGNSNVDQTMTMAAAKKVKEAGIHIITVGVGDWVDEYELKGMASEPYETNAIMVRNMTNFNDDLAKQIKELLCNDVNECSPNPCSCDAECVDKIGTYECDCSGTCVGKTCESSCRQTADVVFAVDGSGSMDASKFRMQLDFLREVMMRLNPAEANVGVLKFSDYAEVVFNFGDFATMDGIMNAVTMSYTRGSTNTSHAIQVAMDDMFSKSAFGRLKVLVLLTDGRSSNFEDTWRVATEARKSGIEIIAVKIGQSAYMKELNAITSGVDLNVFSVTSFDELSTAVEGVSEAICNNVDECEAMECNDGAAFDHVGYCECVCPLSAPAATGHNCERSCTGEMDIMLVVDSSGSIGNTRWNDVKEFLAELVNNFEIGEDKTRVGANYFSTNSAEAFVLNSQYIVEDVMTEIQQMPFLGQRTNIASALELTENMLTAANGDRPDVLNIVILLSDGASNERELESVPMAVKLRENGALMIVVAIGDQADTAELRSMATYPLQRNYLTATSFNDIRDNVDNKRNTLIADLLQATCDDVNECDNDPCLNNANCVDLPGTYYCECGFGISGSNCERTCPVSLDVAIVLDLSDSMETIYDIQIDFVRQLIYGLPSSTNVAIVYYSDDAEVLYHLGSYPNSLFRLNALSFSQIGTKTNTAAALNLLVNQVFVSSNGDDSALTNHGVILTDGGSSVNRELTAPAAQAARDAGITLYAVAFGTKTQMDEINAIASNPDSEYVFELPDVNAINSASDAVLSKLCSSN